MTRAGRTSETTRRLLALSVAIAGIALAGCGSSAQTTSTVTVQASSPAGTTAGAPTASTGSPATVATAPRATAPAASAGPLARANAICTRRNQELRAVTQPRASLREIISSASRRAAIQQAALKELRGIQPPRGLARNWQAILAARETTLERTLRLSKASPAHGAAALKRQVALLNQPNLRLLVAAVHSGVRQCGVVAGPSLLLSL